MNAPRIPQPAFDRRAIMRDAHKRFRDGKRLGLDWSWSQCLSTAWAAAKMRRAGIVQEKKNLPDFSGKLSVNPVAAREGLGFGDRTYLRASLSQHS